MNFKFLSKRHFTIVPSQHLERLLKNAENDHKILIIDVREPENFAKGRIQGAINWDSRLLLSSKTLEESPLLKEIESTNAKQIDLYFHCHMSLIRGPLSSSHVEGLLKRLPLAKTTTIKVHLIEGGWKGWKRKHPDLVELGQL